MDISKYKNQLNLKYHIILLSNTDYNTINNLTGDTDTASIHLTESDLAVIRVNDDIMTKQNTKAFELLILHELGHIYYNHNQKIYRYIEDVKYMIKQNEIFIMNILGIDDSSNLYSLRFILTLLNKAGDYQINSTLLDQFDLKEIFNEFNIQGIHPNDLNLQLGRDIEYYIINILLTKSKLKQFLESQIPELLKILMSSDEDCDNTMSIDSPQAEIGLGNGQSGPSPQAEIGLGDGRSGPGKGTSDSSDSSVNASDEYKNLKIEAELSKLFYGNSKRNSSNVKLTKSKDYLRRVNTGRDEIKSILIPVMKTRYASVGLSSVNFLVDVSGSISSKVVSNLIGLVYQIFKSRNTVCNIYTWNTGFVELISVKDLSDLAKKIRIGGGTSLEDGITYINNIDNKSPLVIVSDFEDDIEAWVNALEENKNTILGINHGSETYDPTGILRFKKKFKYLNTK